MTITVALSPMWFLYDFTYIFPKEKMWYGSFQYNDMCFLKWPNSLKSWLLLEQGGDLCQWHSMADWRVKVRPCVARVKMGNLQVNKTGGKLLRSLYFTPIIFAIPGNWTPNLTTILITTDHYTPYPKYRPGLESRTASWLSTSCLPHDKPFTMHITQPRI